MAPQKILSSKSVITSSDIQVCYEQLYEFLMDFLWEFQVVQALANLEIAVFKRFPDKDEMLRCLRDLKVNISQTYNELNKDDKPEFKEAFDKLEEAINDFDEEKSGCELYCVEELISEREVDASEDLDSDIDSKIDELGTNKGKKKFKFGEIEKTTKAERGLQNQAADTLVNPFENTEEE